MTAILVCLHCICSGAIMSEPTVYSLHAVDQWLTCSCSDLDELVRTSMRGAGVRDCDACAQ
jgi:hypothetical protein